jgi:hypothetical protein
MGTEKIDSRVRKTVEHFVADLSSKIVILNITQPTANSNNSLNVRVSYPEKDSPGVKVLFRAEEDGVVACAPEHLENSLGYLGRWGLKRGSRLLEKIVSWARAHGELIDYFDERGHKYSFLGTIPSKCPHRKDVRVDEEITGVYRIHPEVYQNP